MIPATLSSPAATSASPPVQPIPLCPITGLPASRRIQPVSARLVSGLWRWAFGVRIEWQLAGIKHFGLWESPCGLAFFEPMLEGDARFYLDLYQQGDFHRLLTAPGLARGEFKAIAELARPGDTVLDVGCGEGGLARHVPQAAYVGLDPNFPSAAGGLDIRNETIAQHAALHPAEYDVVCAFHVIEHVSDPLAFARELARCVKPGGRLCIAVPSRASAMTDIPNFVFNAPPHHLSWWNESALRALAERLDLIAERIEPMPFCSHDSIVYWMGRSAPNFTRQRFFRAHWAWYCGLVWSWVAGRASNALFRVPPSAVSGLLLVAGKRP